MGIRKFTRQLRIRLSEECRKAARARPFNKMVSRDSSREDGLQLADMMAGAVRHFVIGDEGEYYKTFTDKVVDLWQVTAQTK
jgi:hypothetical protein